jgi:mono/diheme cytochrome c family protein
MKLLLVVLWTLFVCTSQAQQEESAPKTSDVLAAAVLGSKKSLSASELAGKKIFIQRCSVCHLPGMATYPTFGPLLDGNVIASESEAAVRKAITVGSSRMPGFQYTLTPAEIDQIVLYLKTLHFTNNQ